MAYSIKEIYFTLQGEGINAGQAAVFCRFSGCNLWNGNAAERLNSICSFCDTDFIGLDGECGGKYSDPKTLADTINRLWNPRSPGNIPGSSSSLVVFTGGEPLLQLDSPLIEELKSIGFRIAVESNGSIEAPDGIDWLTISPKESTFIQKKGQELKLVYPQVNLLPELFEEKTDLNFEHYILSPMWLESEQETKRNIQNTIDYCLGNPFWRISIQQHKIWGIA